MAFKKEKTDKEIVEQILFGGRSREKVIDYLIHRHTGMVYKMMIKTVVTEEEAKDAFTDSLLAVINNITNNKYVPKSKLSTYLYQIFYFKCVDLKRKNPINRIESLENAVEISDETPDIYRIIGGKREISELKKLLHEMGEPCKTILLKWGEGGYSMKEIAEVTGLENAEKAKKKKHYCLKVLMNKIRQRNIKIEFGKGRKH